MMHFTPRVMFAGILVSGTAFLVMLISGLTGMVVDSDARVEALKDRPATSQPNAEPTATRELEALRDLFAYCRQGNWGKPPCVTEAQQNSGTVFTTQRVPADFDDSGDTNITVERPATQSPTSAAPKPKPTKKVQPPSSDGGDRPRSSDDRGNGQGRDKPDRGNDSGSDKGGNGRSEKGDRASRKDK